MNIDEYIYPDRNEKIILVRADDARELKGQVVSEDEPIHSAIMQELNHPYHQTILRLNQCSRNLGKNTVGSNVLYLSQNEGCFPRTGISIKSGDEYEQYPDLNYVDLVLDQEGLKRGEFRIYSHEVAHNMFANIWPDYPEGKSTMPHISIGITDYYTAFNEGWAEHFERWTIDSIDVYGKIKENRFKPHTNYIKLWLSEYDGDFRYEGALKNNCIYKKLLPCVDMTSLKIEDKILLEHLSPNFDRTRLKNAQEMLSCEGVAASLFYGINSDESIMNSYMPIDYYNKFLIKPLSDDVDIKEMFTPFENAVLKNLWVMSKIREDHRDGVSPVMDFIKIWCQAFPRDRERILQIFINITAARTIDNETARIYEKMSLAGMMGRMEEFIKLKDEYAAHVDSLIKGVLDEKFQIDGNIGKEIWIENPNVYTPCIFWPGKKKPLRININTASLYQLESFPKITCDAAGKIIERRDSNGYIDCIDKEYFLE